MGNQHVLSPYHHNQYKAREAHCKDQERITVPFSKTANSELQNLINDCVFTAIISYRSFTATYIYSYYVEKHWTMNNNLIEVYQLKQTNMIPCTLRLNVFVF